MQFGSASAAIGHLEEGLVGLCQHADEQLRGSRPDLVLVFFTSHFEDDADHIVRTLVRRYPSAMLVGCSGEGVIGEAKELEREPAMALMLGHLPGVTIKSFRVDADNMGDATAPQQWVRRIGVDPALVPAFIALGDPFSVPVNHVLGAFNAVYPGRPVFGGMCSGCDAPRQAVLVLDDVVHRQGLVGVALSGPIDITPVVSQGCRPVGRHLVITACDRHVIRELGGKPAIQRLQETLQGLSGEDSRLAREAIFVGRVINEYQEQFGRGDFLIRNLMGYDPATGAIAVTDELRVGSTIQFHVRDQASADEDLRQLLASHGGAEAPAGALLFSCNGRGTRMWTEPHHDVSVVHEVCGPVPVAGFFAAGELGPIGGRNFIHGHTASLALFRPKPS